MDSLRALPDEDIDCILATLTNEERASLTWAWEDFWLRPDVRQEGSHVGTGQRPPPGDWIWWVNQGGRGSGKSTPCMIAFANDAHELGTDFVGVVLCENDEEARKLIEDPRSGLRAILPPWKRPTFNPTVSGGMLTFPSGAVAHVISAEKPSKGRSPNFNRWLIDDPPKFGQHAKALFDALARAFRLQGHGLRAYIATTPPGDPPPRCPELLDHLLEAQFKPERARDWAYSIAPSDANMTNLDADTKRVLATYDGGVHEKAERDGVYDPLGGAKVFRDVNFTAEPVRVAVPPARFAEISISIDPADSSETHACEVGITACARSEDGHGYLLEDASGHHDDNSWPNAAHDLYERWAPLASAAHFIIEVNRGTKDHSLLRSAEVVRQLRANPNAAGVAVRPVRYVTSRQRKDQRAGPLVFLYRAGRIHHLAGVPEVEKQMRALDNTGRGRLDRADSAVQGLLDVLGLLGDETRALGVPMTLAVGAFGQSGVETIAVGPPAAAAPTMTMRMPGAPTAGAFGRSDW